MISPHAEEDSDQAGLNATIGAMLLRLIDLGHGPVLGIASTQHAGIQRVARPSRHFEMQFEASYRAQCADFTKYANRILDDHALAEDVVNTAFDRVWRRYERDPREIENLDAYVFTVVRNETRRALQGIIKRRGDDELTEELGETIGSTSAEASDAIDMALDLQTALEALLPRYREAVVLCILWELTHAEAARILKESPDKVARHKRAGQCQLRSFLAAYRSRSDAASTPLETRLDDNTGN